MVSRQLCILFCIPACISPYLSHCLHFAFDVFDCKQVFKKKPKKMLQLLTLAHVSASVCFLSFLFNSCLFIATFAFSVIHFVAYFLHPTASTTDTRCTTGQCDAIGWSQTVVGCECSIHDIFQPVPRLNTGPHGSKTRLAYQEFSRCSGLANLGLFMSVFLERKWSNVWTGAKNNIMCHVTTEKFTTPTLFNNLGMFSFIHSVWRLYWPNLGWFSQMSRSPLTLTL